jgi:hypothetical protein
VRDSSLEGSSLSEITAGRDATEADVGGGDQEVGHSAGVATAYVAYIDTLGVERGLPQACT